jgi:hypothetical protein
MNNSHNTVILSGFPIEISLDNFRRETRNEKSVAYFLSHFHSDHYGGLDTTFPWVADSSISKKIYCSSITANLVTSILKIPTNRVVSLEFGITMKVVNEPELFVTLIPANHCPGAAQLLFEYRDKQNISKRVLHCGDMRFDSSMKLNRALLDAKARGGFDEVFLDSTYAKATHNFPSQSESISMALDCIKKLLPPDSSLPTNLDSLKRKKDNSTWALSSADVHAASVLTTHESAISMKKTTLIDTDQTLVLISTYSVGKERLIISIARTFGLMIYAPPQRVKTLRLLGIEEADLNYFTSDRSKASIHIVSMRFLATTFPYIQPNFENLNRYLTAMNQSQIIAPPGQDDDNDAANFISSFKSSIDTSSHRYKKIYGILPTGWCHELKEVSEGAMSLVSIPYSEHSSYSELIEYVTFLKPTLITPTVFSDDKDFKRIRDIFSKYTNQTAAQKSFISLFSKSKKENDNVVVIIEEAEEDVVEVVKNPKKQKISGQSTLNEFWS